MGSIGTHRPKGLTDKEFFEQEYTSMRVLDTSRKHGVIYAACAKRPEFCSADDDPDAVFALVMPYSIDRNGYFVWKEQDETMGPYDVDCPARLLDLLTPTEYENANEWRERCRARLLKAEADRLRAKQVTEGTVIKTAQEVYFGEKYGWFDTFRYMGQRNDFVALLNGQPYVRVSLSNWKARDYEVVREEAFV